MLEQNEHYKQLLHILDDEQAIDTIAINVSEQTSVTDFMIIACGRSPRHIKAIANHVMEKMKASGLPALSAHGFETGDWVLIDFGDYVLHIMTAESRAFYNIEQLWQNASATD